jgi:hypothetical protein
VQRKVAVNRFFMGYQRGKQATSVRRVVKILGLPTTADAMAKAAEKR